MKKTSKITAALLALVLVLSLFAACGKEDNNEEETTTDGFTLQVNNSEAEPTEESTTQAESTTEVGNKEEKTTKVKVTVKIPSITKAPSATKASSTTKAPPATKHEEIDTTVPPTAKPWDPLDPNVEKLLGRYEATFMSEGVDFYLQFVFKDDKSVTVELTKDNYDKMIDGIVEKDAFDVTLEEFEAAGVDNATDYKRVLREYLVEELPYNEMKDMFKSSGTWEFEGDKLYVTIDGETAVCDDDGFMEYGPFFGLKLPDDSSITKFPDGSSIVLSKKA